MNNNIDFEDIRPYSDNEVQAAINRITADKNFPIVLKYIVPNANEEQYREKIKSINTVYDFQTKVMFNAINAITNKTSNGVTTKGFEKLKNEKSYMFISNHRDIVLDSALFQIQLYQNRLKTSEITFGDNLMISQFIIDIGKLNKMFQIKRNGTLREIFINSLKISNYMRYAITEKKESTWIAQRNGRTKDGNDKTIEAVLKMFAMSSKKNFVENLNELSITPIAISYEYEPCDALKTQEIYISRRENYVKAKNEDLNSILTGIYQQKGKISIAVCDTITNDELILCNDLHKTDKFTYLANIIDKRIYSNYQLWKTNYIAYDLIKESDIFSDQYTIDEKFDFIKYMDKSLKNLKGDEKELQDIFLSIYANSVVNKLNFL